MVTIYGESFVPYEVPDGMVWGALGVSLIFPLVLYVLRSIGLFVLARKQGVKYAFIAFIPCIWIYTACMLIAETRFFNTTIGKLAVILTIIFATTELLMLTQQILIYYPLAGNYLRGREIIICLDTEYAKSLGYQSFWVANSGIWVTESFVYPYLNPIGVIKALEIMQIIASFFDIVYIVIEITVLINLFKKFWPDHYVLAFILSVFFGLDGVFIFAIRNKKPVNYADYLRAKFQSYGAYGYYGGRPPYGNQGYQGNTAQQKGPFEDYLDPSERTPDEPFGDYAEKKKDDDRGDEE